jgi:hypothetical protein
MRVHVTRICWVVERRRGAEAVESDRELRKAYYSAAGEVFVSKNAPFLRAYEDEMEERGLMPKAHRYMTATARRISLPNRFGSPILELRRSKLWEALFIPRVMDAKQTCFRHLNFQEVRLIV